MKKIAVLIGIALSMLGCTGEWNDLVHKEVKADITAFGVEGALKCDINFSNRIVDILLPWSADPKAVKLTQFEYTEGAVCKPAIKVGDILDLSEPLTVTLSTYDDYVWTINATLKAKPSGDLYNMAFDIWSSDARPYAADASDDEQEFWSSSNYFLELFNYPVVIKESDFVASEGEGKAAMKLLTRNITELFTLVPGTVFTGMYETFDFASPTINYGVPFIKRPKTMEGFACYKPQGSDTGYVFVALGEWDAPYLGGSVNEFIDGIDSVPGVVGYGKAVYDKEMSAYEGFSIEVQYKNDHAPKHAVIIASSSYKTPVDGSVLYIDELGFTY